MCGGHSLHKKDWAMLAGGLGLAATGLGAAGMGPLAGLLGGEAATDGVAAGATGAAQGANALAAAKTAGDVAAMTPDALAAGESSTMPGVLAQAPVTDLSTQASFGDQARNLLSMKTGGLLGGGGAAAGKMAAAQMAMQSMQGQQPPPMPQGRPMQQGPMEPLNLPFGPGGNSLGMLGKGQLSEQEKQRLRAMGYPV